MLYIWDREKTPQRSFCNHPPESMTHLISGCEDTFGNFHNKPENIIANYINDHQRKINRCIRMYKKKLMETLFPEH